MGHTKIAQSPCQHGNDVDERISCFCACFRVVSGHHGKIARQRFCVADDCVRTTCHRDTETENNDQSNGHDNALDKVCSGRCKESSESSICYNDHCADDHGSKIIYSE